MKRFVKKMAKCFLTKRVYRLIANGICVVPSYYRGILKDAERNMDYVLSESPQKTMMMVRKYAHILDKGLQRPDAEPGHSQKYYELCCQSIDALENTQYANDKSFCWVKDVVRRYENLQNKGSSIRHDIVKNKDSIMSYDEFVRLVYQRRSNRHFDERLIDSETLRKMLEPLNWAASSCNKQPIEVYCTIKPDLARRCLAYCAGGTGFSEYIPSFFCFTADVRGYVWPSEMMLPYVDVSLGVQNFFLAATTLGISGCILSWAQKTDMQERALRELLDIPDACQIVFCAVMGYAAFDYSTPVRKTLV